MKNLRVALCLALLCLLCVGCLFACNKQTVQYRVTFSTEEGVYADVTVDEGGTLTLPADPTKEGYIFAGWFVGDSKLTQGQAITGDIEAQARWESAVPTVSFVVGDGSQSTEIQIGEDGKIAKPADPVRAGYDFQGWYQGDTPWDFENNTVSESTSLSAKWSPITYSITVDLASGEAGGTYPATYTVESDSFTLPIPARHGYAFVGWSYEGADAPVAELTIAKGSTGDRSFTAVWTLAAYSITLELDGGSVEGVPPTTYTMESAEISITDPKREGYTFAGWSFEEADAPVFALKIPQGSVGDKTFTATWTPIPYSITVDLAGGSAEGTYPDSYTVESEDILLENPTKDGYVFAGWSCEGVTGAVIDLRIPKGTVGNKSFTAVWTLRSYEIKLELDGGSPGGSYLTQYTTQSADISFADPVKPGYDFAGWISADSTTPILSLVIPHGSVGDKSYTATWTLKKYSITIVLSGGSVERLYPATYTVESEDIIFESPKKTGYTFDGWLVTGADTPVLPLVLAKGSTGDKTFTAVFTPISYRITYQNLNGAENNNPATYTVEDGEITLSKPTLSGFSFKGWLDKDGNAVSVIDASGMQDIELFATWTELPKGSQGLEYVKSTAGDSYIVKGLGTCTDSDILIPPEYEGLPVTQIASNAFSNKSQVKSVVIPDSVTVIGGTAFSGSGLKSVTIGSGVQEIGNAAFNCHSLEAVYITDLAKWCSIDFKAVASNPLRTAENLYLNETLVTRLEIPQGVTRISPYAFYNCRSLLEVVIGNDVREIGKQAFAECDNLTKLHIPGVSQWCGVTLADLNANPLYYAKTLWVNGEQLKALEIPAGVSAVGAYTFATCSGITKITVNADVESIGASAFYECPDLTEVLFDAKSCTIDSNAFSHGGKNGDGVALYIGKSVQAVPASFINRFVGMKLSEIKFKEDSSCKSIGASAFSGCAYLTELSIPASVESIGKYAFSGCANLERISLGDKLEALDEETFYNCTKLRYVTLGKGLQSIKRDAFTNTAIEQIALPASLQTIGNTAFSGCTQLSSISIPDSVQSIGPAAFTGCKALALVTVGKGVTSLGANAFKDCVKLSTLYFNAIACADLTQDNRVFYQMGRETAGAQVIFGEGVTAVPAYLFAPERSGFENYTPYITSVTFAASDAPITVGAYAFYCVRSLQQISLPQGLGSIGNHAFYYCTSLKAITLPDATVSLGELAFGYCTSLADLRIGKGLESLGAKAFYCCTGLESVYFNAVSCNALSTSSYVFQQAGGKTNGLTLTVGNAVTALPAYLFHAEKGGETTANLRAILFEAQSKCQSIGMYAFYYCTALTEITLPQSLATIGNCAFLGCSRLYEVFNYSPMQLTPGDSFGGHVAFYAKLVGTERDSASFFEENDILFYFDAAQEKYYAFAYVGEGDTLTLPDLVKGNSYEIAPYAFASLGKLRSLTVGKGVSAIGQNAFRCCYALQQITFNATACADLPAPFTQNGAFLDAGIDGEGIAVSFGKEVARVPAYLFSRLPDGSSSTDRSAPKLISVSFAQDSACTAIGAGAFYDCSTLAAITFPAGLLHIEQKAFGNCAALPEICIPDSVQSIGASAFYGCSGATSLTVGEGVQSIGAGAFTYTRKVATLYFNAILCADFAEGMNPFSYIGSQAANNTEVIVGSKVQRLPAYIFRSDLGQCYITRLRFAEGSVCKSIGEGAFAYSETVHTIQLPASLTSIETKAFYKVTSSVLKTIDAADYAGFLNITVADGTNSECNPFIIAQNRTLNGAPLTKIVIPADTVSIPSYAFFNLRNVTEIYFNAANCADLSGGHNAFTYVGFDASHVTVTVGKDVQRIPANLFNTGNSTSHSYTCITDVVLEEGCAYTHIGTQAFAFMPRLVHVELSNALCTMGMDVFAESANLQYNKDPEGRTYLGSKENPYLLLISIPDKSITEIDLREETLLIGAGVYSGCEGLISVSIPDRIRFIGSAAFSSCTKLETLVIGKGVSSIASTAFGNCTSLKNLTLGENVTSIGDRAFYNCDSLLTLNLSGKIESVGARAFENCGALYSVTFGDSVVSIGAYAFYNCTAITTLHIGANVQSIGVGAFSSSTKLANAYFAGTDGWRCAEVHNSSVTTAISANELSRSSSAAKLLSITHATKVWTRTV